MDINLDNIALALYGKLQTRFPDVEIGDENGEVLSKEEDIPNARFFEFPYKDNGVVLGTIAITLDQKKGLVLQIGGDLVTKKHPGVLKFIRSLGKFAKPKLLNFKIVNLEKSNLDKRDYQFQAKRKETAPMEPMMESKMYGTAKISYQDLGEARLVIKHSQPVNTEAAAGRTMHVDSIYVENAQGERFRYPFKHLNGARALAEHLKHGGHPYDGIGKHITGLSEELAQLRKFKGHVSRNEALSEAMGEINSKVMERIEAVKKEVQMLQRKAHYESFAESFEDRTEQVIPEATMNDWIDRLTIRTFNEDLKSAFPYIFRLVDESQLPVRELGPEDMLRERAGSMETTMVIMNPNFNAEDDESPEEIEATVYYDISGEYYPATRDDPAEYPEIEIDRVIDTVTGQDITQSANLDYIMGELDNENSDSMTMTRQQLYRQNREPDDYDESQLSELSKGTIGSYVKKATSNTHDNSVSNLASRAAWKLATAKDGEDDGTMDNNKGYDRSRKVARAVDRLTKEEMAFESFINRIGEDTDAQDGENTLLSNNPQVQQAAVEKLNQLLSTELKGGPGGINSIESLKGIIDDPELQHQLKDLDPDLDARALIQQYVLTHAADIASQLEFGSSELGGEAPAALPEPLAPPPEAAVPPEAAPAAAMPQPAAIPPAPVAESTGNAKLKAKFIRALESGATLETIMDFGHRAMTLGEAIAECGMSPEDVGVETAPEENGVAQILKSIAGFWNKEEKNFTIGGTKAKQKIIAGFKDGEFPNATADDVTAVLAKIERMDPSGDHDHVMKMAGVPHDDNANDIGMIVTKLQGDRAPEQRQMNPNDMMKALMQKLNFGN